MSRKKVETDYALALTDSQGRLYAYIVSLVVDADWARDILQNTNRVLLEKADAFEPGTNFIAWAFKFARLQVMAARKSAPRNREVLLDEELTATIAEASAQRDGDYEAELAALSACMKRLDDRQRTLIVARYQNNERISDAAARLGVKPNTASQIIHRARLDLADCIRRRLAESEDAQ